MRPVLTGRHFGAISVSALSRLYGAQRQAVEGVIRAVHAIATTSVERERPSGEADPTASAVRDLDRPHHSFVINGVRGRGKTTALVTLRRYLSILRLDPERIPTKGEDERSIQRDLAGMGLAAPKGEGNRRAGLVIPVVFAEDMEPGENPMDAIFALMQRELEERIASEVDGNRKSGFARLLKDLQQDVTASWAFARGLGHDTLVQDTLNYGDYVAKRADLNRQAYDRIPTWHAFLERFLDELGYELLIVLFDDTDLDNRLVLEILGSVRIYLAHPRAVSVLAADMRTLQLNVQAATLSRKKDAVIGLYEIDEASAFVRQEVSDALSMLDKVLPPALRWHLGGKSLSYADDFFREADEADGTPAFESWCLERASGNPSEARAWWLVATAYKRLAVATPRRIVNFKDATSRGGAGPLEAIWQFSEISGSAPAGVELEQLAEEIAAKSILPPWEVAEDSQEPAGTPEEVEHFVDLWLDRETAESGLAARQSAALRAWLPRRLPVEPFDVDPRKRSTLGVAGVVGGGALPRNCLYMHNFRRLSQVVFERLPEPSRFVRTLETMAEDVLYAISEPDIERLAEEVAALRPEATRTFAMNRIRRALLTGEAGPSSRFASEAVLVLFAIAANGSVTSKGIAEGLQAISEPLRAQRLQDFLQGLTAAVRRSERLRQEALFTWACAVEIASSEDPKRRDVAFPVKPGLAVGFGGTEDDEPRITILARETLTLARRGGRNARLLLWSLAPILPTLHAFGSDYVARGDEVLYAWRDLAAAFQEASPSSDPWNSPDLQMETVHEIDAELTRTAALFSGTLSPESAGGASQAPKSRKKPDAVQLLAEMLGTSVGWIEGSGLVARAR